MVISCKEHEMRFIINCPFGCKSKLIESKYIIVNGSLLLQCNECGQPISS